MDAHAGVDETAQSGPTLEGRSRTQAYLFVGVLFFLTNFAAPHLGLVDVPVSFFLKNRLHLSANQTSMFRLIVAAPLIVGFVFGFVRDSWNPFGHGDRAHLFIFSVATVLVYGALAFLQPTYAVLLVGVFLATVTYQMTSSVANGLTTILAQANAMAGGLAAASLIASYLPQVIGYFLGGVLSDFLEGQNAVVAARVLFLCAASLMLVLAVVGLLGPRAVFDAAERTRSKSHFTRDLARFARHWPIYPVILMQLLWQFSPATGTVLQYHMSNTLHGSDAQWGEWNAIFLVAFIPGLFAYGYICRRVRLSWLLWGGFGVAVLQMIPLLFINTAEGALVAAAFLGVIGAFAQGALTDLSIRSAPRGLEGTMGMMFIACFYIAFRFGDLFGTALYDRYGFAVPVIATIVSTALVLPVLLIVPKRLIETRDGEQLRLAE
jgi:MFS family permease